MPDMFLSISIHHLLLSSHVKTPPIINQFFRINPNFIPNSVQTLEGHIYYLSSNKFNEKL